MVPRRIMPNRTILPNFPLNGEPAVEGQVYFAWTNSHGCVSAILPDGKLGLRADEFDVIEWVDPRATAAMMTPAGQGPMKEPHATGHFSERHRERPPPLPHDKVVELGEIQNTVTRWLELLSQGQRDQIIAEMSQIKGIPLEGPNELFLDENRDQKAG
jgi:hypothetical protein